MLFCANGGTSLLVIYLDQLLQINQEKKRVNLLGRVNIHFISANRQKNKKPGTKWSNRVRQRKAYTQRSFRFDISKQEKVGSKQILHLYGSFIHNHQSVEPISWGKYYLLTYLKANLLYFLHRHNYSFLGGTIEQPVLLSC